MLCAALSLETAGMNAAQETSKVSVNIQSERDPVKRFFAARDYLDSCDNKSVDLSLLRDLVADEDDLIRAEAADFLIVTGGLTAEEIKSRLDEETSAVVRPRLWLALALADPEGSQVSLKTIPIVQFHVYERAYFDAAMFVAFQSPSFLYDLCAVACSDDPAASHTAIDLLRIVGSDRPVLLRELVSDLRRQNSDNVEKASAMLAASEGNLS